MAVSTAELTDRFQAGLAEWPPEQHFCVAYSGGNDSLALLVLAHRLLGYEQLRVLHVHHGLSDQADCWLANCRSVCQRLGRPLIERRVDVATHSGQGPEAAARMARYQAFAECLKPGEVLMLAHHRDDQVETVLLRLLSGAGLDGLCGMPQARALGAGWLWRPLLDTGRAELNLLVRESGLYAVSDPSNTDHKLERGFLRTRILPLLKERYPGFESAVLRSRQHIAATRGFVDQQCQQRVERFRQADGSLDVACLRDESPFMLAACIRWWLRDQQIAAPSTRRLESFIAQLSAAAEGRSPQMRWDEYQLRRYRDRVYLLPRNLPPALDSQWQVEWALADPLALPDRIEQLVLQPTQLVSRQWHLLARSRRPGDRLRPSGHKHSRSLKYLFQQAGEPPWLRVGTPVICHPRDGRILAVGDRWLSRGFARWLRQRGLSLHLSKGQA